MHEGYINRNNIFWTKKNQFTAIPLVKFLIATIPSACPLQPHIVSIILMIPIMVPILSPPHLIPRMFQRHPHFIPMNSHVTLAQPAQLRRGLDAFSSIAARQKNHQCPELPGAIISSQQTANKLLLGRSPLCAVWWCLVQGELGWFSGIWHSTTCTFISWVNVSQNLVPYTCLKVWPWPKRQT